MGTALAGAVFQQLPYGLPKLIVSTMASGFTAPYVGLKDIAMMNAVTDISGINSISREVYRNAAAAVAGHGRALRAGGGPGQAAGADRHARHDREMRAAGSARRWRPTASR